MESTMLDRRQFLAAAAGAAVLRTRPVRARTASWPPFRGAHAIDALGGVGVFWLERDDPALAAELAIIRASGLTGVIASPAPQGRFWLDDEAFERARRTLDQWRTKVEAHPDHMLVLRNAADLECARRERRLGVTFTFQGTEPLGEDIDRIALFHALGLRVMQLTHNRRNLVGDGCQEPGNAGLSRYGLEVIERLEAQRIAVDLSHAAQRTAAEAIAVCKAPMLIGHTGCRALADLPRNTGDAELRAMADKGGVVGIIFWPYLRTDTQPMADDVIRHIEHAINVCGEDHVGIGTDGGISPIARTEEYERENLEWVLGAKQDGVFEAHRPDALYTFIPDLNVANRFEVLASWLAARGHSDARIGKILGGNFARVLGEVWG
jgi:membrane dipeptidase